MPTLSVTTLPELADPADLAAHEGVRTLVETLTDDIGYDAVSTSVDEILSRPVSGFIPYTDGGFDGWATFDLHGETSYAVPEVRGYVERDEIEMLDTFLNEHDLDVDRDLDGQARWDLATTHDEWEDFETSWRYDGDPCCWFVKVRALFYTADHLRNVTGSDEYLICVGVNTDFNYGRDSISWCKGVGTTWFYETNEAVSALTPERLTEIRTAALAAWRAL